MFFKDISEEAQTLVKKLGMVEADLTGYYMAFEDCQLERLDAERPTLSFESFLQLRVMARQFITRMAV